MNFMNITLGVVRIHNLVYHPINSFMPNFVKVQVMKLNGTTIAPVQ